MRVAPLLVAFVALVALVACGRQARRATGANAVGPHRMSDEGLRRIQQAEAFIDHAYDDGIGNQTIGFGHLVKPGESFPAVITEQRAGQVLAEDVARVVNPALDRVTVPLTQNQVDALGSFIYNVGPGNFARFVLPALNAGQFDSAISHMASFTRGKNQRTGEQITMRGLERRRSNEIALFQS